MLVDPPLSASEDPARAAGRMLGQLAGGGGRGGGGAFSGNTERAVRSDLAIYAGWCAERGLRALPATAETVAAFIDAMAESRAPATVRRYVASIAVAHRAVGRGKTMKSQPVTLALARMHRRKGRRQDQAAGLTWPLRQRLMEAAGDRVIDDRNRALLAVAYDAMLRRSELAALQVDDLLGEMNGTATLLVRRSKTDGEGEGEIVYLARDTVLAVRAWLARSGIAEGRLFRSVARHGRLGERLDPSQVPRILKAHGARAPGCRRQCGGAACPGTQRPRRRDART